jgi:tetratricopeptide (TPR) repeat protein
MLCCMSSIRFVIRYPPGNDEGVLEGRVGRRAFRCASVACGIGRLGRRAQRCSEHPFGLLAIWAYVAYVRQPSAKKYFAVSGLFIFSLAAKPMLVTLPFLLLLLDVWPLGRFKVQRSQVRRQIFAEKIPLLAIAGVSSAITIVAQRGAGTISSLSAVSLFARISNAIVGYRMYIDKLIVPIKLAVFYPNPRHWQAIDLAASSLILLIITAVVIAQRHQCPWLLIGWLWFLGTLVPDIGLVQGGMQSIANRYTYIPAVGIFIMIAWSLPTKLSPALGCGSRTLFTHATQVTQGNYIAYQNLGNVLQDEGELDAALEQYQKAANEYPEYATIHENIGNVLLLKGRFDEALLELKYAVNLNPNSSTAFNSMGWIYLMTRQYEHAATLFRHAIDLNPENEFAQINYGTPLVSLGRYDEAIAQLARVAQAGPDQIDARTNLALALAGRGDVDQAVAELQQVLQVAPDCRPAREALQEIEAKKK